MKILWKGNVFNPTGIATANREMVKALLRQKIKIQCTDPWSDMWEFNKNLEKLNYPINANAETTTIFSDYPNHWHEGKGRLIGHFVHEGTRIFPEWVFHLNRVEKLFVPSIATRNLFKWNDVKVPMEVISYGVDENLYKPDDVEKAPNFVFLSVNSWTGEPGDRKGTDLLIKAFDEEFKEEKDVRLLLKISSFWQKGIDYMSAIHNILGHTNDKIMFNDAYVPEEELATYYQKADCFVAPTKGESFGLTIANALACGLPVIVTKDKNSGQMDYCQGRESVLWIDTDGVEQGPPRFYIEGNMLAKIDFESLKKQMRYAYEHKKELKEKALKDSEFIRKNLTWDQTAKKILKFLKEK
jgi:hypothetical protein